MYTCEKHGVLESEWCNGCGTVVQCDCQNLTSTRFKDLIYDCDDGERTVTVYIVHCETCGRIVNIE